MNYYRFRNIDNGIDNCHVYCLDGIPPIQKNIHCLNI